MPKTTLSGHVQTRLPETTVRVQRFLIYRNETSLRHCGNVDTIQSNIIQSFIHADLGVIFTMPRLQTEELSEFEKQRLANIAERDALLKKLTLEAQSSGVFAKASPKPSAKDNISRPKKKPTRVKNEDEAPIVRRMSSRLRGIQADSEVAKRKADEAFKQAQKVEREKRLRKSDFFTLDNMLVSGQKLSGDALIGIDVVTKGVAKPYERTFGDEDVKNTKDGDLKALREDMSSLELWDQWTPGRTCIDLLNQIVLTNARWI